MRAFYLKEDQHYERNIKCFREMGAGEEEIFSDHTRKRKKDKSRYNHIKKINELSIITVPTFSTFGSTAREIYKELTWFLDRGVKVSILEVPDSLNPKSVDIADRTLRDTYFVLAKQEREKIKEKSYNYGRKPTPYPDNWEEVYHKWKNKEIPAKAALKETGLSRSTFYSCVRRYETTRTGDD